MSEVLVGGRVRCDHRRRGDHADRSKAPEASGPAGGVRPGPRGFLNFDLRTDSSTQIKPIVALVLNVPANHERQCLRFALPSRRVATRMQKS
jgi:hypothetical protein